MDLPTRDALERLGKKFLELDERIAECCDRLKKIEAQIHEASGAIRVIIDSKKLAERVADKMLRGMPVLKKKD